MIIHVGSPLSLPESVAQPDVTGVLRGGNTLTASNGAWSGSEPFQFSYRWLRCEADGDPCVPIPEASQRTYLLVAADFGSSLRVAVTAANAAGWALATSSPTARVKHECRGDPCSP
jgi:hypothetical protein